jgi:hypothetical protein
MTEETTNQTQIADWQPLHLTATTHRHTYLATFIQTGPVKARDGSYTNWHISPTALKGAVDAHLLDSRAVFVDHPEEGFLSDGYPSIRNLVGVTTGAYWNELTQSIDGVIRLYDHAEGQWAAALIDELIADQNAGRPTPDVGLSIVFFGTHVSEKVNGKPQRTTVAINHVESCDLVFGPAANGRIRQALSTHGKGGNPMTEERSDYTPTGSGYTVGPVVIPPAPTRSGPATQPPTTTDPPSADVAAANLVSQVAQLRQEVERLQAVKVSALGEEVSRLRTALGQQVEPTVVTGMGSPPIPSRKDRLNPDRVGVNGMWTGLDRLTAAYEHLMGLPARGDFERLTGIRELYTLLTGDRTLTGRFNPTLAMLAYDSGGNNADTTSMAEITRNVMNKVMIQQIDLLQDYRWWERIAYIEDFNTLQQISWVRIGGIGDLPTVAEKAEYTQLLWDDARITADWIKKGGYLPCSLEMIDRDDVSAWRQVPRSLATAAIVTLSAAVSALFTDNAGVGPSITTEGSTANAFSATWGNLITQPLDYTNWQTAVETMYKLGQFNVATRRITARPKYILVPVELEAQAISVVTSERRPGTNFNDRVPTKRMLPEENVITVPHWTDADNWAALADPNLIPFAGIGFRYGRSPELFTASDPNTFLLFTNDVLPIKVRWLYAVSVIDPRGAIKSNC